MPLIIPKELPAYGELSRENVFVMHQQRAQTALLPLGVDAVPGCLLIGAQGLDVRHQNAPCVQP